MLHSLLAPNMLEPFSSSINPLPSSVSLRYTKLFTCLSWFLVLVLFTFQAEAQVHGVDIGRLGHETSGQHDDSSKTAQDHERKVADAIAQELFFHPTEMNFYESRWVDFLEEWSQQSFDRYLETLKTRPGMSQIQFFALDLLNWDNMTCSLSTPGYCTNMPSNAYIRAYWPDQRHTARRIIYTLEAIRKAYAETDQFIKAIEVAKRKLQAVCGEIGEIFFHSPTSEKGQLCSNDILNIVLSILGTIITVVTLGDGFVAMAPVFEAISVVSAAEMGTLATMQAYGSAAIHTIKASLIGTFQSVGTKIAMGVEKLAEGGSLLGIKTAEWAAGRISSKMINLVTKPVSKLVGKMGMVKSRIPFLQSKGFRPPKIHKGPPNSLANSASSSGENLPLLSPLDSASSSGDGVWRPSLSTIWERSLPAKGSKSSLVTGVFGIHEAFTIADQTDAVSDEHSLYARTNISHTPWFVEVYNPAMDLQASLNDTRQHVVDRTSVLFRIDGEKRTTAFERGQPATNRSVPFVLGAEERREQTSHASDAQDFWELGGKLIPHFRHQDGKPLRIEALVKLLESHENGIVHRWQNLRKPENQFPTADIKPQNLSGVMNIDYVLSTALDHLSWRDILGGVKFDGINKRGLDGTSDSHKFQWKVGTPQASIEESSTGYHKRDTQKRGADLELKSNIAATHDLLGFVDTLQAFGLSEPVKTMKRSLNDAWSYSEFPTSNMFSWEANEPYFTSEIKQRKCGPGTYGKSTEGGGQCYLYIQNAVDHVKDKLVKTMVRLNTPPDLNAETWEPPLVTHLKLRYSTYANFIALRKLEIFLEASEAVSDQVLNKMKNNLISKIYTDQQCYVKCTSADAVGREAKESRPGDVHYYGDTACLSGCYEPVHQQHEELYGLNYGGVRNIRASLDPYNISEVALVNASYDTYNKGLVDGFLSGEFNLDPYQQDLKDTTPMLPVCKSDYLRLSRSHSASSGTWPCTCGDKYGSQSELFWASSVWLARHWEYEDDVIEDCREGPLSVLKKTNPAAYLINMCNVFYKGVMKPGAGSHQESKDKGDYYHNYEACRVYWKYYEEHKDTANDAELDVGMCKLWSRFSKNWDKGGDGRDDFSYVNDDLEDNGCKPYKKFWRKKCHRRMDAQCDMPWVDLDNPDFWY
ncbi:hypothetical protein BU24DRAFT_284242 [Aaosphaeria arxii CBS 175.79]|uniref:Uncharacterized protein n=1 Tax=Aaosphaeria arxii CBS 175.79 TaxID=1450172 RepID=A0A6A5XFE8_9PLEO|nr:uncharacterized protein BU24DRAFT_284242 [Aaosphaeria arxii CBS 175.79]KAF2011576.1 hypothetical protein BU24DRAFT_284242 [Aaosphaeria arxii CBS 175.79]